MKIIPLLFLFIGFISSSCGYTQTLDEEMKSIDSLQNTIINKEIKRNHLVFDLLIDRYRNERKVLPTAQITLALAERNDIIKAMRKEYEDLDHELLSILLKDSLFRVVHDGFTTRGLYTLSYYNKVKSNVKRDMSRSPEVSNLINNCYRALVSSNLGALIIHVEEHKAQNKYINYPLPEFIKKKMLSHPAAKRIEDEIAFLKKIIAKKEQKIINL